MRIYFGTGGVGTYFVSIYRGADVHWNGVFMNLNIKTGPAYDQNTELTTYQPIGPWYYGSNNYPPPTPQYYRVERDGGVLTVFWSDDGAEWNTAWTYSRYRRYFISSLFVRYSHKFKGGELKIFDFGPLKS